MDLRYIPDDLCFTDEPKDTCTSNPGNFQPLHYHNSLQNFKAKFDWFVCLRSIIIVMT
jgi:hypothetical protein